MTSFLCVLLSLGFFCNHFPIRDVSYGRVKVDPHLGNGLAAEGEALGVVLEVYLPHDRLGILVEFQFDDIEIGTGEQHDIYPAFRRVHLYAHQIVGKEREDDEQHLLVMPLIVGDIAIRHCAQKWVRLSCGDNRANGVKVREFGDVKVGQLLIVHLTK